jgi:transcription-repair coupling factor (superfamily II helicase)
MSGENLDFIIVPPAREVLPGDTISAGLRLSTDKPTEEIQVPGWQEDIPYLSEGKLFSNIEYYLPLIYEQPGSLLDYLPEDAILAVDDELEVVEAAGDVHEHAQQIASEQTRLPPSYPCPLFEWQELRQSVTGDSFLELGGGLIDQELYPGEVGDAFQLGPRYGGQVRPFLLRLRKSISDGERTVVVSRQAQRLAELWREDSFNRLNILDDEYTPVESLGEPHDQDTLTFVQGSLTGGFTLKRLDSSEPDRRNKRSGILVHLLTDAEIFGWNRPIPRRRLKPRPVAPETPYADITTGDYVVHLEFGIGCFEGLVVRTIGGTQREYLQVNFANGDVLYVPVHQADRLSKWVGPDDSRPVLHRLGEKSWRKTKAKAQEAVNALAEELLALYAVRESVPGYAFSIDSQWQAELEASFPYQETEDQLLAIAQVKSDMERPNPMDRLICGDVGYGKTEVALRAAFKAVMDGKQVAMLVPTTVLTQQHYHTFQQRLRPFPVNVEMLSRFRTQSQQEKIIAQLREGQIDIVLGTHRLLSEDVSFKDLGLLLIDEEQRFGVGHKEKLKQLRTEVDVLTMTATPIPRTLYMSLTGVRDISQIDTAPADRLPVQTYVGESDDTLLQRAILREIDRGGQIFYVHNRVQTIGKMRVRLSHLVPEAKIAIGHGQMNERDLEEVMLQFIQGDIDILLSTTIIENGLDIPNANTLIVDRADQFGLSQLYQLRGRVGRGVRRAYAYFLHPPWHRLTSDAKARLDVIDAQTDLGAGYTIAMRDLEIRGAGDLLGSRQSGHIGAIGFDLYTRLLTQAVKRQKAARKGEQLPLDLSEGILIDLPLAAYIPTDYVSDTSLRLRLYRRMAVLGTLPEIDDMAIELVDRFGTLPDPLDNLLFQLRIKVLAEKAGIPAITTESGQIQIRLTKEASSSQIGLQRYLGGHVRVSRTAIWMKRGLSIKEWKVSLVQLLEKMTDYGDAPEEIKGMVAPSVTP